MNGRVLYRWPAAARFGRVVPKTKFYEYATIPATVRERFIAEVERIKWAYKLADATVHLRGDTSVPEIQVFVIDAKDDDVSDDVLTIIDKAVAFPIIFEINRRTGEKSSTRMVAAYKQVGGTKQRLSRYFSTDWFPANKPRAPLPSAVDLSALYTGLLTQFLPLPALPGERLADVVERVDQAHRLEREIAALGKSLRNEPQFNRKIELRRELRERSATLGALSNPGQHRTEDDQWRS